MLLIIPKPEYWTIWTENGQKDSYPGPETGYEIRIKYDVYNIIIYNFNKYNVLNIRHSHNQKDQN